MSAEQRVAIAKDVLKHLASDRIIATGGSYLEIPVDKFDVEGDLQEILMELNQPCEVCALGGLMFAEVYKNNAFTTYSSGLSREEIEERLEGIFSKKQLAKIETAFEVDWMGTSEDGVSDKAINRAMKYCEGHSPDVRLKMIMENIIYNDGKFKPKKRPPSE